MLSREVMGMVCLGVVWLTALLVAGAAWQDLRDLRSLARRARRALEATVTRGDGDGGALAEWSVEQTGRAIDGEREALAFHDRSFGSRVFGGEVEAGGASYRITSQDGQVWPAEAARDRAAACANGDCFEQAYAQARKAKGFRRHVRVAVRAGERVWVMGEREDGEINAPKGQPLIVSSIDPAAFCARKSLLVAIFIPAELAACAAATRVACTAPRFGTTSVVGAILCVAFFLGVTPLAVALRESVRVPNVAYLRGTWTRPRRDRGAAVGSTSAELDVKPLTHSLAGRDPGVP